MIDESDWFTSSKDPVQKAFFGSKGESRALQELRTGDNYANREAIDGKIDNKLNKKETARSKRLAKQKELKLKKKKKNKKENNDISFENQPINRMKNSISKGVSDVA